MSAIVCTYNLAGEPADFEVLHRMIEVSAPFGPDSKGHWINGPVALGHRGLWVVEESLGEIQPVSDGAGRLFVVADCRIDNREELIDELRGRGESIESPSDADLILLAYNAWGTGCAARIVGDFAFAIWDVERRRLFCARDALGVRPFFYYFDGSRFRGASLIRQLLQDETIDRTYDESYMAAFLVRGECPSESTPYESIKRLLAGSSLVIERGGLRKEKYWDLDPQCEISYRTDGEYEEHFRTVFGDAVRAHIRSAGPVWAELSGGLDSSSIVCMAQEIYGADRALGRGFNTLTYCYDQASQADERRWSQTVVEKYGLPSMHLIVDEYWPFKDLNEGVAYWDEPTPKVLFNARLRETGRRMLDCGAKVLLSGIAGDQVFLGDAPDPVHLADYLRGFQLRRFVRELVSWQKQLKVPMSEVIVDNCVKPLLNPNTLMGYTMNAKYRRIPKWIDSDLAERRNLQKVGAQAFLPRRYKSPAAQQQYLGIMRTSAPLVKGPLISPAIEARYPFLYRPLVEFAMAIPMEQKVRPGDPRSVLRRAMVGILPEQVRTRKTKAGPDQAIYLGMNREWSRIEPLLKSSRLASLGYIDSREFRHAVESTRIGYPDNIHLMLAALSLEIWIRGAERAEPGTESLAVPGVPVASIGAGRRSY
ncbi:MAG: asparagine synthase-related protein [Acidobacteriota bacterium]